MNSIPKVVVALATYNGGKYLKKQLDSILNQDYQNLFICIRDDGSTDNTLDIIREYENSHDNILLLESHENLGVPNSFYEILRECPPASYYAFADQDDIWEPFKISRAVEFLEKEDDNIPLMYCSSFSYYEGEENYIRSFDLTEEVNIYNSIYFTPALGFTLVFNEKLREMGLRNTKERSSHECGELHDRRFLRVAAVFGKVICDAKETARHIRHEDAVTSADAGNGGLLMGWLKNELFGQDLLIQQKGIQLFLSDYREEMNKEDADILQLFADTSHGLKKVFYPYRLRQRISGEILLRILFLFHKA